MKKILGTIIVAVAFAGVSTVDAKQLKNRRQQPTMSESAANVANIAQDALNGQATGKDVIETVKQEAQTEEEAKTMALMATIEDLKNKKAALQKQISQQKWFGAFRNTAAEKDANNQVKEQLNVINGELATAQKNLSLNRKEVSRSWYDVSVMALKAAVAVGVPVAVIADLYYGTGYTKGAITEVRAGMPRTRAAARRAYEAGKGYAGRAYTGTKEYAGQAYDTTKDYAGRAYNRLPNMRRRAVDNTVNPVGPVTESYYNQP